MNLNRREFVEGSVAVAGVAIAGDAFAVSSAEGVTKMKKVDLAVLAKEDAFKLIGSE